MYLYLFTLRRIEEQVCRGIAECRTESFDGLLSDLTIDGYDRTADWSSLTVEIRTTRQQFLFIAGCHPDFRCLTT